MPNRTSFILVIAALMLAACRGSMTPGATRESVAPTASADQFDISYRIGLSGPAEHKYDIEIDLDRVRRGTLELQLPVWSPGRYAPFYFAKNVTDFRATNGSVPLRWDRINGSLWRIFPDGARNVTVHYRVYGNTLSGTFSVLDTAHANWNGPSLFMYVVGHKPDPVRLHVALPIGMHIVNGDTRTIDQTDYAFPNYDLLIDTPTEIARNFILDTLRIDARIYRAMIHHNGPVVPALHQRFLADLGKIVRYENTVFDPPPLEMYTFLFNIGYAGGDGMEHLYSTQIVDNRPWSDAMPVLSGLSAAAHEYFHVWNMKRVRAAALGPFDYTHEVYQPSLWVGEGWTQYYGMVALPRSGVQPEDDIYAVATSLVRANLTAPGRKEVSARMSSFEAPFFDGSRSEYAIDPDAWMSYYIKGAGIALYLDLFIREQTANRKSLDDAFRLLRDHTWNAPNASYYLQGRGYTEEDVVRAVSEAAGVDMHQWFDLHVGSTEDMDYEAVLSAAGMRLVRESAANGPIYRVEPISNISPAQRVIRDGWVHGTTSR